MSYATLKAKANALSAASRSLRKTERQITKKIRAAALKQKRVNGVNFVIRKDAHHKRTVEIRNASRAIHLARAFLKGVEYNEVENKVKDQVFLEKHIMPKVLQIVFEEENDVSQAGVLAEWLTDGILMQKTVPLGSTLH